MTEVLAETLTLPAKHTRARGAAVFGVGAVLVAALALFVGSNVSASLAQRDLRAVFERGTTSPLHAGDPVARLRVPLLGLDLIVIEGTGAHRGPVHVTETALPGESGTSAIEAGRFGFGGFFSNLDRLSRGDELWVQRAGIVHRFVVTETRITTGEPDLSGNGDTTWLLLVAPSSRFTGEGRIVVRAKADR